MVRALRLMRGVVAAAAAAVVCRHQAISTVGTQAMAHKARMGVCDSGVGSPSTTRTSVLKAILANLEIGRKLPWKPIDFRIALLYDGSILIQGHRTERTPERSG